MDYAISTSRGGEVDGACSTHGGEEKLTQRSGLWYLEDGDRLLTGRRRSEDNIKAILKDIRLGGVEWIRQAHGQEQRAGFCEDGNETPGPIKCSEFLD